MGEHMTPDGKFRSDKFRVIRLSDGADVTDDKLVMSFHDRDAHASLRLFGALTKDRALGLDVTHRLDAVRAEEVRGT